MDEALYKGIESILASLQQEVLVLDMQGRSLLPAGIHAYYLPNDVNDQHAIALNGYLFRKVEEDGPLVLMTAQGPRGEDVLALCAVAIRSLQELNPPGDDATAAYLRVLSEEMPQPELEALCQAYEIPVALPRCVLMLSAPGARGGAFFALKDLVPLNEQDRLLEMDRQQVALILALDEQPDIAEVEELALALQDTVREETSLRLSVGVGGLALTAAQLHQSALEAAHALELGPRYLPKQSVFVWDHMLLPRLLAELPAEKAQYYHSLLFHRGTAPLFTQEMLDTIDMFLQKDLNMSDTARQLYIHRNTLVYRLDKVQRLCGLDLRKFDDAFVYKLLSELKHSLKPKAKRGLGQ